MTALLLLLKATILIGLVALAQQLAGSRMSAATRHLLWTLTLVALLALPAASTVLPSWTAVRTPAVITSSTTAVAVVPPATTSVGPDALLATAVGPAIDVAGAGRVTTAPAARFAWTAALATLYVFGVVLMLVRLILQRLAIRRIVQTAIPMRDPTWQPLLASCARRAGARRAVRLLRSAAETMPMTFGMMHPTIILPALSDTWTGERREAVLLHELAHVVRHDCLIQALAALTSALYWVHPGVWWIARRLRRERELACDDAVLATGTNAREYAGHLLEIAYEIRGDVAPALAISMASRRQIEGRMLSILEDARNRTVLPFAGRLAFAVVIAAALLPIATASTAASATDAPFARVPSAAPAQPVRPAQPAVSAPPAQPAPPSSPSLQPGTWEIRPSGETGVVYLRLTEGDGYHGFTIDTARLSGLAPSLLAGAGGSAAFSLRRDAGTFNFEGIVRSGVGAGTFTFVPNQAFAEDMTRRGFERPTSADLRLLAMSDFGVPFLNEVAAQGYARPTLAQMTRAAQHGVTASYLRDMGRLGYRVGRIDMLVELRDHGVTPEYVTDLSAAGFSRLSAEELRRVRDHGITGDYIRQLHDLGYRPSDLDIIVSLHDRGITPEYIRSMSGAGLKSLPMDVLLNLRNHGVTPEYIRDVSALGYANLSTDQLVDSRNHGITPEYIRDMASLGYAKLPMDALIDLRNHGVTPDYIQELAGVGYSRLRPDELVKLRNHGVTREQVARANQRAGTRLSVDALTALASRGWR